MMRRLFDFCVVAAVAVQFAQGQWQQTNGPFGGSVYALTGLGVWKRALTTGVGAEGAAAGIPLAFSLEQNYPNLFNPSTTIAFAIPRAGRVSLRIFNVLGEEAVRLVDGVLEAGPHTVAWNAVSHASGVYFCALKSGSESRTMKMILLQ